MTTAGTFPLLRICREDCLLSDTDKVMTLFGEIRHDTILLDARDIMQGIEMNLILPGQGFARTRVQIVEFVEMIEDSLIARGHQKTIVVIEDVTDTDTAGFLEVIDLIGRINAWSAGSKGHAELVINLN